MSSTERPPADYQASIRNRRDLAMFLGTLAKFDTCFCDLMAAGGDFTLRVEIHGNKGKLIHCRVTDDCFQRPDETR